MIRHTIMLVLLWSAFVSTGCFDSGECTGPNCTATIDAGTNSAWTIEHSFFITAGSYAEAQLEMQTGGTVDVEFVVDSTAVDWDMHSHDQDEVVIHLEGNDVAGSYSFTAPVDGTFFPTWANPGPGVIQIDVRLKLDDRDMFVRWR